MIKNHTHDALTYALQNGIGYEANPLRAMVIDEVKRQLEPIMSEIINIRHMIIYHNNSEPELRTRVANLERAVEEHYQQLSDEEGGLN